VKNYKLAGLIGGILALGYFIFNVYQAIAISKGFSFAESLLPELVIAIIVGSIFIAPAIVLLTKQNLRKNILWIAWLYPIVLGLGMLNVFYANDPLEAGLPIMVVVLPFCIIFSLILLLQKR
jgi:hypothetical protein